MRSNELKILVRIDEEGHASDNSAVVNLVMSAVQNVVDTTGQAFQMARKKHQELFRGSIMDLLSTKEAQENNELVNWFSERGMKA